ncbi:MAG: Nif3-like dinuclear metal center hexameric protein [Spirochaetes bacterium]|nr:Nif3-like dinuclear metal center hexameric protein [Spirochaetota bacterium]
MRLKELKNFFNEIFKDYIIDDYLKNGLEIEGKDNIKKILFGVSFNKKIAEFAIKNNFDAIITHHGLFGKSFFEITGIQSQKIKDIITKNISLFSFHLPLDKHREIGNNITIAKILDLENIDELNIGYCGINVKNYSIKTICDLIYEKIASLIDLKLIEKKDQQINKNLNHFKISGFNVLLNNEKIPEKIGIISGGSAEYAKEAYEKGCDLYICGELKLHVSDFCYETGLNLISLGHYYSEIFGIINLKEITQNNFEVETYFYNDENIL